MRHIVFGRVSTFRICIACDQATTNRILFWNYHLQLDRFEEEFICPYIHFREIIIFISVPVPLIN
jgi:hypothetical protein